MAGKIEKKPSVRPILLKGMLNRRPNMDFKGRESDLLRFHRKRKGISLTILAVGLVGLLSALTFGRSSIGEASLDSLEAPPANNGETSWLLRWYLLEGATRENFSEWLGLASNGSAQIQAIGQTRITKLARAEKELKNYLHFVVGDPGLPNVALGIFRDGIPLYSENQGYTLDTIANAASVAKSFTAVSVLILVDDGKIKLDDNIALYFPDLPTSKDPVGGKPVTIRHLLEHTSGISYAGNSRGGNAYCPGRKISYYIPAQYRPSGEDHSYSNFNYNLLSCIVEQVSKKPFPEFVRRRILIPTGMTNSRLIDIASGASGLNTTVNDLGKFGRALFDDSFPVPLISPALKKQMIAPPTYLQGKRLDKEVMFYALGVRVQYHDGIPSEVYHTGIWYNTFAEFRVFLNEKTVLAHLGNPPYFRSEVLNGYRDQVPKYSQKYIKLVDEILSSSSNLVPTQATR